MDRAIQIVIEVDQFKLSREAWLGDVSRHVIFHATGVYKKHPIQSAEHSLKRGTQVALPWSSKLVKINFHYFYIDDKVKVELGESEFIIPNDSSFKSDGTENRIVLPIYPRGGNAMGRIGKVLASVFIQELYDDGMVSSTVPRRKGDVQRKEKHYSTLLEKPPENFRFRRLNKAVNWQRLRTTDIERIIESNNVQSVLSCMNDVAFGDVTEEDCDPRIQQVLQVAQFSVQYLMGTKKVLDEKKTLITEAIEAFDDEEKVLDLKLAKLRARTKAYKREMEELDLIADSYKHTLRSLGYRHNRKTSSWEPIRSNIEADRNGGYINSKWENERNYSSDDYNNRPIVSNSWKEAKKSNNPAFPSMTKKITVDSARNRMKKRPELNDDEDDDDDDDGDNLDRFHPSNKENNATIVKGKVTAESEDVRKAERDLESEDSDIIQQPTHQKVTSKGNQTHQKGNEEADSDGDVTAGKKRKDFFQPSKDDSFDRTTEITQKSKQSARGSTIIEVASMGSGKAREIRPIVVRSTTATPALSVADNDNREPSSPTDASVAPKKMEKKTPPRGNFTTITDSKSSSPPDAVLADTNKSEMSTFGGPTSTGVISVDSLMPGTKSRSESKDDYKADRYSNASPSHAASYGEVKASASSSKSALANTFPMRAAVSESKNENDSLLKSSSGIYHISNSSMDMESFEDHSSFADLEPLASKLITKPPTPTASQVPRVSKNELYLEDSEDYRDDLHPASPSPFKRMQEESKVSSRDGSHPASFRGSGRSTPLSMRGVEERNHDPYEQEDATQNDNMRRIMQGVDNPDDEEYSQSFVSSVASPRRMIDTSRSTVLELNFDTEGPGNIHSDLNSGPNSFAHVSGPPTRDYPSSKSSPMLMNYEVGSFTRRGGGDDDAVLMGTSKFAHTGAFTFSDASSSHKSRLSGTENIEKDSLGGTFQYTDATRSEENLTSFFDESSHQQIPQGNFSIQEESSFDNYLDRRTPSVSELSRIDSSNNQGNDMTMDSAGNDRFSSNMTEDVHPPPGQLRWEKGRAPLDLIELAEAFEVHVSGMKVYPGVFPSNLPVYLEIEFLETKSPASHIVRLDNSDLPVSVSYSTYMSFTEGTVQILSEEIQELQDKMSIQINVVDAETKEPIGQAIVEPWIMIENGVNILRKDVELFDYDMRSRIGDMVVDVKGYLLFCKYGR